MDTAETPKNFQAGNSDFLTRVDPTVAPRRWTRPELVALIREMMREELTATAQIVDIQVGAADPDAAAAAVVSVLRRRGLIGDDPAGCPVPG